MKLKNIKQLEKEIEEIKKEADKTPKASYAYYKNGENLSDNLVNPHEKQKAKILEILLEQTKEVCRLIEEEIKNYKEFYKKFPKSETGKNCLAKWEALVVLLLEINGDEDEKEK